MLQKLENFPAELCCFICGENHYDEDNYGAVYKLGHITLHYFCLLMSSDLIQCGSDSEGILGFLPQDIKSVVKKSKKAICVICEDAGASVRCSKCNAMFHFPCGIKKGSSHQFFGQFKSLCPEHRVRQRIPKNIADELALTGAVCIICLETVSLDGNNYIWATCCRKNGVFHRGCLQRMACSFGSYTLKCPLCNNKRKFVQSIMQHGIYVPHQDASWEKPNAFNELLERYQHCDTEACLCPEGRRFNKHPWQMLLCTDCGSQGVHNNCLPSNYSYSEWKCDICSNVNSDQHLPNPVEDSFNGNRVNSSNDVINSCQSHTSSSSATTVQTTIPAFVDGRRLRLLQPILKLIRIDESSSSNCKTALKTTIPASTVSQSEEGPPQLLKMRRIDETLTLNQRKTDDIDVEQIKNDERIIKVEEGELEEKDIDESLTSNQRRTDEIAVEQQKIDESSTFNQRRTDEKTAVEQMKIDERKIKVEEGQFEEKEVDESSTLNAKSSHNIASNLKLVKSKGTSHLKRRKVEEKYFGSDNQQDLQSQPNEKPERCNIAKRKHLMLHADDHGKYMERKLAKTRQFTDVTVTITGRGRAESCLKNIEETLKEACVSVIFLGSEDVAKNESQKYLSAVHKLVSRNKDAKFVVVDLPVRYDRPRWCFINRNIRETNKKLRKIMAHLDNVRLVDLSMVGRSYHDIYGQYLNYYGKIWLVWQICIAARQLLLD
ncbi:uncharacterized protein LOC111053278 [Nilaparvata lugens]|uniref:uncharacterized protein LOC111053278 n=1 Tax=Nilaparvata lugens TaxID=108931 RepID=UPI00193D17CA|nr:uncharacterized protein LOC111053278 [Nilaparvata lugens]XP_039289136.1 uncharacterized protein LOC111053278 [Nilaparvata lugens]